MGQHLRSRTGLVPLLALAGLGVLAVSACNLPERPILILDARDSSTGSPDGAGPDVLAIPTGRQLGESCEAETAPCRPGLSCVGGVCQASGDSGPNTPCAVTAECSADLHCSLLGVCAPAGPGDIGAPCASAADCKKGLWCELVGFSGRCAEAGDGGPGDPCGTTSDCAAGLVCAGGACAPGNLLFGADLFFLGVKCAPDAELGAPFRVLFEVPRGEPLAEFFRLPTPNDVRVRDGRLDLSGFPTPGPGPIGVDLVQRTVDAAETDLDGWSTSPSVLFRFSAPMDMATITNQDDGDRIASVHLVDIDPDSDTYGERIPVGWAAGAREGSRRKYHCQNWLAARPAWERPLAGGRTYAMVVTSDVKAEEDGASAAKDSDFAALLDAAPPDDPHLLRAWTAYAPFRNYLASGGIDAATIAGAAVFTTQQPRAAAEGIRPAVRAAQPPAVSNLTLCDGEATSPCDDGLTGEEHVRGCFDVDPAFYEVHGKVSLPVIQKGTPPYLTPRDGGDVEYDAQGRPVVVRTEEVCFALTIPKGVDMPAAGWPVVLYAHGTGGTFRNHVGNGTAAALSRLDLAGDDPIGVAVLGADGVLHGSRKGATDDAPDELFFNAFNPRGSRGNVLQGAADQHALTWLLETLTIPAASSPTGAEIRFAPDRIAYVGHSQGGTVGMPFLAFEPGVRGAVLSGTGGGLLLGLLGKTSPQNIGDGIMAALQDEELGDNHPVLNLIQTYFDAVDSLNYAERMFFALPPELPGRHILQTYGQEDTYTPPNTMRVLASAMRLAIAEPVLDEVSGVHRVTPPVEEATWWTHNKPITGVMVQAAPNGYDGHFVLFRDEDTKRQFRQFVETMLRGDLPTIPVR